MGTSQVVHQQRRGPDRGAITPLPRVLVDDFSDQRVDDLQGRGRAAAARGIPEAVPQIKSGAALESIHPVVNRLTTDVEQFRDEFDGFPIGEPEHGLCPAPFLGQGGMDQEVLQFTPKSVAQEDVAHQATPLLFW